MLWTLVVGIIVGAIAKMLIPGREPGGFIITILLGVAGAMVAHLIGESSGWYHEDEPAGFVASVVGAVILLVIYRVITIKEKITRV